MTKYYPRVHHVEAFRIPGEWNSLTYFDHEKGSEVTIRFYDEQFIVLHRGKTEVLSMKEFHERWSSSPDGST